MSIGIKNMQKGLIAIGLALMLFSGAGSAHALSCLPVEDYLNLVVTDEETQVFIGTATKVTSNHTQVVTVTKALKGWVAPKIWVEHQWSQDWQYFCSNGPAAEGKSTVFLTTINEFGVRTVTQTLPADSQMAKDFIADLEKADPDAGITEATGTDRASELRDSIYNLLKTLVNMFSELKYWETQK